MDIKQSIKVNTNASKAWEVIGPNFLNIADWGRGINSSWKNDSAEKNFADAPAGGRFCDVAGFGTFDERTIHYNSKKHEISWSATGKKLPKFILGLQNAIKVEEIDSNTCLISSNITANLKGILGFLMGSTIKKNFSKTLYGFINDWKTYAETGQVSEKKSKELERNKINNDD